MTAPRKYGVRVVLDQGRGRGLATLRVYQRDGEWYVSVRQYRRRRAWSLPFGDAAAAIERAGQRTLAQKHLFPEEVAP